MSRKQKILLGLLLFIVAIQFIRPVQNSNNQGFRTDVFNFYHAPQNVEAILKNSCYDCHSNNTHYPWYANIQPFGWWLAHHIKEGKDQVNFSEFASYTHRRQISKLKNIESSITDGSMPLLSYTLMHRKAKLTTEEKKIVIDWLEKTRDSLSNNVSVH